MVGSETRTATSVAAISAPPLRVVFLGTPEFAVPSLEALLAAAPHLVVGVVTQPDRPRGRGQRVSDSPVKTRALAAGLSVLQPERMKDPAFLENLAALNADLGVVAAYGKILTTQVLATPRLGMINVHASLLPRYRGAAPVHRAVIAGERSTGVTIMRVVRALDAGGMIATEHRSIGPDETSDEVERDLARLGARLLVAVVDQIARGNVQEQPQDERLATYAHRLTKADGVVDWSQPAGAIHNLIRGLHPWPHAYTWIGGQRVILHRSACRKGPGPYDDPTKGPGPYDGSTQLAATPGTIVEAAGDQLIVATGEGLLQLLVLQVEGKRPMPVRQFLAGHPLVPGQRFVSAP
jgi:methionyl-tRNA formyltransferase